MTFHRTKQMFISINLILIFLGWSPEKYLQIIQNDEVAQSGGKEALISLPCKMPGETTNWQSRAKPRCGAQEKSDRKNRIG